MLRRLLLAILVPPLVIGVTLLVLIGLRDFDLLLAITGKLILVIIIIGIPLMILRMIVFPAKWRDRRR